MQVQEIMTTGITTVGRNDDLRMVADLMEAGHLRHIPVLEDADLVGIVSQRDVFSARMSSTMGVGEKGQRGFLHTILVKEVMRHPVTTIGPEALVSDAAAIMIDQGIGCLPVIDDGRLVGIITKTDLLRRLRGTDEGSDDTRAD
jgi:acetoin utilization protein AcuB